jgi:peptidoglycan/LPS O-acetylase OafA/YrhL
LVDDSVAQAESLSQVKAYYAERSLSRSRTLDRYGRVVHVGGLGIGLLVVAALIAMVGCRGRERAAAVLFGSIGLTLLVAAVATVTYEPRYALPAIAPLAAAGALAVSAITARMSERRHANGFERRRIVGRRAAVNR